MATYTDNKDVDWSAADSIIHALGGDDEISGINPSSVLMYGGNGHDDLSYGELPDGTPLNGAVVLYGDAGNDQLDDGKGAGTSHLYGGEGNDILDSDRSKRSEFLVRRRRRRRAVGNIGRCADRQERGQNIAQRQFPVRRQGQ